MVCWLIWKIRSHGFQGNLANWIQNWYKPEDGGKQLFFRLEPCNDGVPQGSVPGPLLLVIHINDLEDNGDGKVSQLAGDTKIDDMVQMICRRSSKITTGS